MDIKELKNKLTLEHILQILEDLGAEPKQGANLNEILCKTICHNGSSHKLYLYKDSLSFHCYTNCGSFDIFQLIQNVNEISLKSAVDYVIDKFGFHGSSFKFGFNATVYTEDLEIANTFARRKDIIQDKWEDFKEIQDNILLQFYDFYHKSFLDDGISPDVLYKYEIKFDVLNNRVIIPHRNIDGNIVAIRCRNLDENLINAGRKYTPIINNGKLLSAPTGQYFFGLYYNKENIIKSKKVILVESEKAVMQYETMYPNANITLALSSSNLSNFQIRTLKELGVEEVIIALDKEYDVAGTEDEILYAKKIKKLIIDRLNFCTVSVLWDVKNLINKKDSPLDKGKQVFEDLFKNRKYVQGA